MSQKLFGFGDSFHIDCVMNRSVNPCFCVKYTRKREYSQSVEVNIRVFKGNYNGFCDYRMNKCCFFKYAVVVFHKTMRFNLISLYARE